LAQGAGRGEWIVGGDSFFLGISDGLVGKGFPGSQLKSKKKLGRTKVIKLVNIIKP